MADPLLGGHAPRRRQRPLAVLHRLLLRPRRGPPPLCLADHPQPRAAGLVRRPPPEALHPPPAPRRARRPRGHGRLRAPAAHRGAPRPRRRRGRPRPVRVRRLRLPRVPEQSDGDARHRRGLGPGQRPRLDAAAGARAAGGRRRPGGAPVPGGPPGPGADRRLGPAVPPRVLDLPGPVPALRAGPGHRHERPGEPGQLPLLPPPRAVRHREPAAGHAHAPRRPRLPAVAPAVQVLPAAVALPAAGAGHDLPLGHGEDAPRHLRLPRAAGRGRPRLRLAAAARLAPVPGAVPHVPGHGLRALLLPEHARPPAARAPLRLRRHVPGLGPVDGARLDRGRRGAAPAVLPARRVGRRALLRRAPAAGRRRREAAPRGGTAAATTSPGTTATTCSSPATRTRCSSPTATTTPFPCGSCSTWRASAGT